MSKKMTLALVAYTKDHIVVRAKYPHACDERPDRSLSGQEPDGNGTIRP